MLNDKRFIDGRILLCFLQQALNNKDKTDCCMHKD